jgi:hypothetical protein
MMLNCCKLSNYCNIPGTRTVKVLGNLQRVIENHRGGVDVQKIQVRAHAKEEHLKGGEQFPAIQMDSA